MSDKIREDLQREIERVQASGTLGDTRLRRLFDYLASCSMAGTTPKEVAIALDVFDKDATFDVSQDALVRVYIHKLRRALRDFYLTRANSGAPALCLPRGEYRLLLQDDASLGAKDAHRNDVQEAAMVVAPLPAASRLRNRLAIAISALLLVMGIFAWWLKPVAPLDKVRADPIWRGFLQDKRPIVIVVGDYYLVGETYDAMEVKRLVREYSVNSKGDLNDFIKLHPEYADRYMDVGLRYLPIGVAFALRDIAPVLTVGDRRVSVSTMSDLTSDMLKNDDIIYLGYLSGLGLMRELAFAGSRFAVGISYDELVDTKSKHAYVSQTPSRSDRALQSSATESAYRDYGWIASLRGPSGNPVLVVAGTRDEGLRQAAEALTNTEKLKELHEQSADTGTFEGLYEVSALDGVNLGGKLLVTAQRH